MAAWDSTIVLQMCKTARLCCGCAGQHDRTLDARDSTTALWLCGAARLRCGMLYRVSLTLALSLGLFARSPGFCLAAGVLLFGCCCPRGLCAHLRTVTEECILPDHPPAASNRAMSYVPPATTRCWKSLSGSAQQPSQRSSTLTCAWLKCMCWQAPQVHKEDLCSPIPAHAPAGLHLPCLHDQPVLQLSMLQRAAVRA